MIKIFLISLTMVFTLLNFNLATAKKRFNSGAFIGMESSRCVLKPDAKQVEAMIINVFTETAHMQDTSKTESVLMSASQVFGPGKDIVVVSRLKRKMSEKGHLFVGTNGLSAKAELLIRNEKVNLVISQNGKKFFYEGQCSFLQ